VLPGLVDPHTHPGNNRPFELDVAEETKAAAAGGITTMLGTIKAPRMGQPFKTDITEADICSYSDVFETARGIVERHSFVDMGFSYILMDERHVDEIPQYAREHGVTSMKFFVGNPTASVYTGRVGMPAFIGDGLNFKGFEQVARVGGLVMVHAENQQVAAALQSDLAATGRNDLSAWADHSPDWAEAEAVDRAARLAERAGARLYVVHLTSRLGLEAVAAARARRPGLVYAETCPQYLTLDSGHPANARAKCRPPLRSPADSAALWDGLANGLIDCVGTDHIPLSVDEKCPGGDDDVWSAGSGLAGQETLLPLLVSSGKLSLQRIVEVSSRNPAFIFGLQARKGRIAVGSDADLVLVDLKRSRTVDSTALQTRADFTPWDGMELRGWPVYTILRGHVINREGEVGADAPTGRYLRRDSNGG
jgi:allantoinase